MYPATIPSSCNLQSIGAIRLICTPRVTNSKIVHSTADSASPLVSAVNLFVFHHFISRPRLLSGTIRHRRSHSNPYLEFRRAPLYRFRVSTALGAANNVQPSPHHRHRHHPHSRHPVPARHGAARHHELREQRRPLQILPRRYAKLRPPRPPEFRQPMHLRPHVGYDYRGIWVDRGCRATFDYGRYQNNNGGSNTGAAVAAGILGAIIVGSAIAASNNDKNSNHDDTAELRRQYYRDGYRHGQHDWDNDRTSDYHFYNDRYPAAFERDFADGYNDGYNDRP